MQLIKRNLPIFVIAGLTLLTFIGIIVASQTKPPVTQTDLNIQDDQLTKDYTPVLGDPNAPVMLVEFSDFQCPACAMFYPVLKKLQAEFPKDLAVAYRHFPLPQHPRAIPAAQAALAANEQGKFWEYSELLFSNQANLKDEDFVTYALNIGLDVQKFEQDYKKDEYMQQISEDLQFGQNIGINSTPSFYLNGKKMVYNSIADFEAQVKTALGAVGVNTENPVSQQQSDEAYAITPEEIKNALGDITVTFDGQNFVPETVGGFIGQDIIIQNNSQATIALKQLFSTTTRFIEDTRNLVAGQSFTITPDKAGYSTFEDQTSKKSFSIQIGEPPTEVQNVGQ